MSSPWIVATPLTAATRWLDESGVALLARVEQARSSVIGDLSRARGNTATSNGHTSVLATLGIHRYSSGSSAGQATVGAVIGQLFVWDGGISAGSSTVTAEDIWIGEGFQVDGVAAGVAGAAANLSVAVVYRPQGEQANDSDPTRPTSSVRSDGKARRFFTPKSIGRTNSKSQWVPQ